MLVADGHGFFSVTDRAGAIDDDVRAAFSQRDGDGAPKPGRRTCDERFAAF